MNGLLLIDKPSGPTSFDVVRAARRALGQRKVGHAGTLDPLASGLLVVCCGQGTKLVPYLMEGDKRYTATVRLGWETDTDDAQGHETARAPVPELDRELLRPALERFRGEIEQVPPAFSALKSGGEPLHRKARRGEPVTPEPRRVVISALDLLGFNNDEIRIDVCCSKGTYIRSLARDLGRSLGSRAHLAALRRVAGSGFRVADALPLAELQPRADSGDLADRIISLERALPGFPRIALTADEVPRVLNGNPVAANGHSAVESLAEGARLRLLGGDGELIAIARHEHGMLQPVRVFPRD